MTSDTPKTRRSRARKFRVQKFGVRKFLTFAASLMALTVLAAGMSSTAHAQSEDSAKPSEGEDSGGWGETACDGAGFVPIPGSGLVCDAGRGLADRVGGGEDSGGGGGSSEEDGSGDGSTGGSSQSGPGSEPGPGGEAGQGTDDTAGKYGAWTEPINIAQGLVFICAGIGLSAGILTVGTAGGSREQHQKGIEIITNTLAGFIIGTLAVQIYNVLGDVVVGF